MFMTVVFQIHDLSYPCMASHHSLVTYTSYSSHLALTTIPKPKFVTYPSSPSKQTMEIAVSFGGRRLSYVLKALTRDLPHM